MDSAILKVVRPIIAEVGKDFLHRYIWAEQNTKSTPDEKMWDKTCVYVEFNAHRRPVERL